MDRRRFLQAAVLGTATAAGGTILLPRYLDDRDLELGQILRALRKTEPAAVPPSVVSFDPFSDEGAARPCCEPTETPSARTADDGTTDRADPLIKIREFDRTFQDDVLLEPERFALLEKLAEHLERAQRMIGHGHFNLLHFDELLRFGRNYRKIGRFSKAETDLIEELFYADATRYGFMGKKVLSGLTERIPMKTVEKVAGTGHYLIKGEPLAKYRQICKDVGRTVILTSGVRSVVKQFQLYLTKAVETQGNLSQASRSLAPPGYSYHAIGDFDIGKVGFGLDNFTDAFASTDEFKRLIDLGYVSIRYTETNPYGVRHEPWHIKIS